MYEVTIFGLHLNINPVAFHLGSWTVYWYGVIIGLGFLLAVIYALRNAARFHINVDRMLDVILITTPCAVLCARAYFCIFPYADGQRITTLREFFGIGENQGFSGLAIYGAVIGAFVIGGLACQWRKVNLKDMFDLASIGFLIGQAIGRWGNFINQEAFGKATGSEWFGMYSERTVVSGSYAPAMVHPCFLYESLWCLIGFVLLHQLSKKRRFSGQIVLGYGIWYGFGRFFIEYLRDDSLYIGKIKVSMLVSALAFFVCLALYILGLYKAKIAENTLAYDSLFLEQMTEDSSGAGDPAENGEPVQNEMTANEEPDTQQQSGGSDPAGTQEDPAVLKPTQTEE